MKYGEPRVGHYNIIASALQPLEPGVEKGVTDGYRGASITYIKKGPIIVANEYCCGELARQLRLPVPPGFIGTMPGDGSRAYVNIGFNLAGENTPPIDPAEAAKEEPEACAAALVFDIWIVNTDRHRRNVSFVASRPPHRLNLFDHSHAPLLPPLNIPQAAIGRLAVTGALPMTHRQCFFDHITTDQYLLKWIERVNSVPAYIVREITREAEDLGWPSGAGKVIGDFLLTRREQLKRMIWAERAEFPAINEWGFEWEKS